MHEFEFIEVLNHHIHIHHVCQCCPNFFVSQYLQGLSHDPKNTRHADYEFLEKISDALKYHGEPVGQH